MSRTVGPLACQPEKCGLFPVGASDRTLSVSFMPVYVHVVALPDVTEQEAHLNLDFR